MNRKTFSTKRYVESSIDKQIRIRFYKQRRKQNFLITKVNFGTVNSKKVPSTPTFYTIVTWVTDNCRFINFFFVVGL